MDTTERSKLRPVGIEGREIKIPPHLAKISTRFKKHLEQQTEKTRKEYTQIYINKIKD